MSCSLLELSVTFQIVQRTNPYKLILWVEWLIVPVCFASLNYPERLELVISVLKASLTCDHRCLWCRHTRRWTAGKPGAGDPYHQWHAHHNYTDQSDTSELPLVPRHSHLKTSTELKTNHSTWRLCFCFACVRRYWESTNLEILFHGNACRGKWHGASHFSCIWIGNQVNFRYEAKKTINDLSRSKRSILNKTEPLLFACHWRKSLPWISTVSARTGYKLPLNKSVKLTWSCLMLILRSDSLNS